MAVPGGAHPGRGGEVVRVLPGAESSPGLVLSSAASLGPLDLEG